MKPLEMSARFAAFVWYTNHRQAPESTRRDEAMRFASESWKDFLPVATDGLGRLLIRVANVRTKPKRVKRSYRKAG